MTMGVVFSVANLIGVESYLQNNNMGKTATITTYPSSVASMVVT
jgi:hypothetical protein